MNDLEKFCNRWGKGCGAPACAGARNVVLGRGKLPCDVLFVGEAPGESEDVLGEPFRGPAGQLLDDIIKQALPPATACPECGEPCFLSPGGVTCPRGHGGSVPREEFRPALAVAFTNIVCCIPREERGGKAAQPLPEDIRKCQPRLCEFVRLAAPRLLVCVGTLARDWTDPKMRGAARLPTNAPRVDLKHPAAILRMNVASRGVAAQQCVVRLENAVEQYLG